LSSQRCRSALRPLLLARRSRPQQLLYPSRVAPRPSWLWRRGVPPRQPSPLRRRVLPRQPLLLRRDVPPRPPSRLRASRCLHAGCRSVSIRTSTELIPEGGSCVTSNAGPHGDA
jgi:hypothetical protein